MTQVFKGIPNSYLQEWKRNEAKMVEEHCWTITQACSHAGFDHVSVCWGLDFNWTPLDTETELTARNSVLCRDFRNVTTA